MEIKELPLRKCVTCGQMLPKNQLFRLVKSSEGVVLDLGYKAQGRGAYICRSKACVDTALKKKSLNRSLRQAVNEEVFNILYTELENDR
jgi:predicted RNA-binding protein YlxR (DUF448 family)